MKIDLLIIAHIAKIKIILSLENMMEYKDIDVENVRKHFLKQQNLYILIQKSSLKNGFSLLSYSFKRNH